MKTKGFIKLIWPIIQIRNIAQSVFHDCGYRSFILFFQRIFEYTYFKILKRGVFVYNSKHLKYFYSLYNTTFLKERSIEIPIAMDFIKKYLNKQILEVGNVLNHYYKFKHDVVDKFEVYPGVINEDILTYNPDKKYDLIISISTIEHIGWDENPHYEKENKKEKNEIIKVFTCLTNILKNNGKLLVTFPLGYNSHLDELLKSKKLNYLKLFYMKRISKDNRWKQVNYKQIRNIKYCFPYQNANGLVIGIMEKK